ncbi:MAG: YwpF family protein [Bacillus sp. (in: firmicutes)]
MKSFRLISLQIFNSNNELVDIELTEGLVINKEDEHYRWLLECFIHKTSYTQLQQAIANQKTIRILGIITKKENSPATFDTEILTCKRIDDHYSVLFEGSIVSNQNEYAELLLKELLSEGLEGPALIMQFKEKMRTRPQLAALKGK